jgi:hypothetical protein
MPTIRSIAWALLFGIVMTVAIAWFCSIVSPSFSVESEGYFRNGPFVGRTYVLRGFGFHRLGWDVKSMNSVFDFVESECANKPDPQGPSWATYMDQQTVIRVFRTPQSQMTFAQQPSQIDLGAGWPWISFRACSPATSAANPTWVGAVSLGQASRRTPTVSVAVDRQLPLLPYWPGLCADVGLLSAAWWIVFAAAALVRARVRRTRGQCSRCGYDLAQTPRELPCPECGRRAAQG